MPTSAVVRASRRCLTLRRKIEAPPWSPERTLLLLVLLLPPEAAVVAVAAVAVTLVEDWRVLWPVRLPPGRAKSATVVSLMLMRC